MGQSRRTILLVVCALCYMLPAAPCLAVGLVVIRTWIDLVLVVTASAAWMALIVLVAYWEFTGLRLRWVWCAAFAATLVARALVLALDPGLALSPAGLAAAVLCAPAAWILVGALRARRHPGTAVLLTFPLRGGRFLVTDGGDGAASFLVNYHYGFGGHRASGVSASMRYAIDVVEIGGPLGAEAPSLLPMHNEAYRIWGRSLYAPCSGVVTHVADDVVDNTAFGPDRPYGVGNHIVIRRGEDVYVVLGHMRCGSVRVRPGDAVAEGDIIGDVGNSGWTERPHVHMQAMRAAAGDYWHGEPLPMRFGGRFLVRNDVVQTS